MNVLCCGRRKEGKTTLALWLLFHFYGHKGVLVWDPRAMIGGHVVRNVEELEDAIEEQAWKDGRPIVYRPSAENLSDEFDALCNFLFPPGETHRWRSFGLLIDEAGDVQTANSIQPSIKRAIAQHYDQDAAGRVTIIQTSHRLPEFHGKSKGLMDELYIFRTTHPGDLDTLLDYTGEPSLLPVVSNLPQHHCVRYKFARQSEGVSQWEVWNDPGQWFTPLDGNDISVPDAEPKPRRNFLGRRYYAEA